jgi:hypothetical protein
MIDDNEKLKDAFKEEFDVTNDQELQKIICFIKDLIIGEVNIKGFGLTMSWLLPKSFRSVDFNLATRIIGSVASLS